MSAEIKPGLIIVAGTFDHTPQAKKFYGDVEEAFGEYFETSVFSPVWKDRGDQPQDIIELTNELDAHADQVVKDQLARGGVLFADEIRRPSLLGLSVGGTEAFYAMQRHPNKYHRAYAVAARTTREGVDDLRKINRAGAKLVEIFSDNRSRLDTSRVRTGSPVKGDNRVSLAAATISPGSHDTFQVSDDHIMGTSQIATGPEHVRVIIKFLKAA